MAETGRQLRVDLSTENGIDAFVERGANHSDGSSRNALGAARAGVIPSLGIARG